MKNRPASWLIFAAFALLILTPCVLRAADGLVRYAPDVIREDTSFQGDRTPMRIQPAPLDSIRSATGIPGGPAPCEPKFQPLPWGTDCNDMNCCGPDACCPQPCGDMPCFPPPEFFYARFSAIAMTREGGRWKGFASLGELAADEEPDIVLSSDNIEFPFQGGGELTLGWSFMPRYYLEFDYFELTTWDKQAAYRDSTANSAGGNGTLFSPFGNFGENPINQFDYNNFAFIQYRSNLNNYELNIRHQLCLPSSLRGSILFGGRAMRIYEAFDYQTTSDIPALGGTTNTISTSTRNKLLGLQVGGELDFHVDPRWWINVDTKAGICQNKIGLDSVYTGASGIGGSNTYRNRLNDSNTTFVGEIGVTLVYEHGPHLTCDVGYRAMWLTGLALAPQNLQTNSGLLALGPVNVDSKSDVVYHGPRAGLTLRW